MIEQKRYINENTGEYRDKVRHLDIFNDEGYLFWSKKYSRKQFHDIKLSDHIGNGEDFRRVHLLSEMLYKDTNVIAVRENSRKIRVADIEDIANIIELNIRRTKEFLNRMIEKHVIAKRLDKVGDTISEKYLINPLFFFCGRRLTPDLYFLFKESLDSYLPAYVIKEFHERGNIAKERRINP